MWYPYVNEFMRRYNIRGLDTVGSIGGNGKGPVWEADHIRYARSGDSRNCKDIIA